MNKPYYHSLVCLAMLVALTSCKEQTAIPLTSNTEAMNTTNYVVVADKSKEALGKLLFFDPILSGNRDVSCATCHHPDLGYADNLDLSIGTGGVGLGINRHFKNPNTSVFVKRNSQTILNTVFNGMNTNGNYNLTTAPMFWDSRVSSLELQALEPIKTMEEMRGGAFSEAVALDSVVARLRNIPQYQTLFTEIFGGAAAVSIANLGSAIASFERTLTARNSPYDRYIAGDRSALSNLQIQGIQAFKDAGCSSCHTGNMFSDYKLHTLSVPDNTKLLVTDKGANNTYSFRTASLRNLRLTAPYMHSGVFQNLDQVLQFYGRIAGGNSQNSNVNIRQVDPLIRQVRIGNRRDQIVAFINSLSDETFDKTIPAEVPSKLLVGGNIR